MRKALLLAFVLFAFKIQNAQTPTWAQDIAPILYANCTTCHHDGGLAPFSLITYAEAVAKRTDIGNDVITKKMPPWPPDANYIRLAHERLLSQTDITKIKEWVMGGVPAGDTAHAPTAPTYTNGSALGTPDLSLTIPTYSVPGNQTNDIYQCFAIPTNLLQNKFITAMEIVPGNPSIVHHVLVYQDTTGTCAQLDAASPGAGYTNFGGVGTNKAILIGGWVPGSQPYFMPPNMGTKLYKNSYIILQVHYPAGSAGKSDNTTINLKLANSIPREVALQPILNHFLSIQNGPLYIPADSVKTFTEHYKIPYPIDISVLSVGPHCHLLGTNWISFAVTPNGDTIPLIKINNWDFHWQGFYQFRNVLKIPGYSDIYAQCTYDNTSNNPNNPSTPPRSVSVGESTTDEMMLVYFSYLIYQNGDENIVIDNTPLVDITDTTGSTTGVNEVDPIVSTIQLYDAVPNPAKDQTLISYFMPQAQNNVSLQVFDISGKLVDEIKVAGNYGYNGYTYNTAKLGSGTYLYSLVSQGQTRSKQLIITK